MIALLWFFLAILAPPFKSKCRLEVENAALRQQAMVLRRQARGRIHLTNFDRLYLIQLYRWFPAILRVLVIVQRKRSFAGIAWAFAATGAGNRARGEGGQQLEATCAC